MFKKLINRKAILMALILMLFIAIPSSFAEDSSTIDLADNSSSIDISAVDSTVNSDDNSFNKDINYLDSKEEKTYLNSNQLSDSPLWTIEETGDEYDNLTQAINAASSGYTIIGASGTADVLDNMTINKDLTIKALNRGDVNLAPSNQYTRLFNLKSGVLNLINLEFMDFTVSNGYSGRIDGAVACSDGGNLYVENCSFENIKASNSYGAVFDVDDGDLTIVNCSFDRINSYSAAIYVNPYSSSQTTVKDSTFKRMTSTYNAGSIYAFRSDLTIDNCVFKDSSTAQSQVYSQNNVLSINNTEFRNLTASGDVAALSVGGFNTYSSIDNSVFDSCVSTRSLSSSPYLESGAIFSQSEYTNISNSIFTKCRTTGQYSPSSYTYKATAGAIMMGEGEISYSVFLNNSNNENNPVRYDDVCAFGPVIANFNYWASNAHPNSTKINENLSVENWYILTMDIEGEVYTDLNKEISFNLNSINNTEGIISDSKPLKDINLTVDYSLTDMSSSKLNIIGGLGTVDYISANYGYETARISPGDVEFTFYVSADPSTSIYVANEGSDSNSGSFDNPYRTIEYALSQVTDTRNIIYIKEGSYNEHDLNVLLSTNIFAMGDVTIDAEENGRIFNVESDINFTLKEMTLKNGKSDENGGAISFKKGNLTLVDMVIQDSSALNGGAIYSEGLIYISNSIFANNTASLNGGAILSSSESANYIVNSNFTNNGASDGGAIYSNGTMNLLSNSFIENQVSGDGGAVYLLSSNASVDRNTFRANNASNFGGALFFKSPDSSKLFKIINNVLARNKASQGGAIYLSDLTAILSNNSMSAYQSANGGLIYLDNSKVNAVISILNNDTITYFLSNPINITASIRDDQDNLINGGLLTFKIKGGEYGDSFVELGSSEITDGIARYEFILEQSNGEELLLSGDYTGASSNATVKTGIIHPELKYWFIEGGLSYEYLKDAVANAEDGDVIYGLAGNYTVDMINIDKSLTIKGLRKDSIIIKGNNSKIFNLTKDGKTVNLVNLTLSNGASTGYGGLIEMRGALNIVNSTFKDTAISTSNSQGGAIYAWNGSSLDVKSSVFRNLSSSYYGGAIRVYGNNSILNVEDSLFDNISCKDSGSAIFSSGVTKINGTNFTHINGPYYLGSYGSYAGAVFANNNLDIDNSIFIDITGLNSSAVYLANEYADLNIQHSVFVNNTASGTTVWSKGINNKINYCIFADNFAMGNYWDFIGNGQYLNSNDLEYNYWGSNEKPLYNYNWNDVTINNWVVLDLSVENEVLIAGTNNEILVDFSKYTDGNDRYDLEDVMPDFVFDLEANEGTVDSTVLVQEGIGIANYLAPNENVHIIVEIQPGDEILEFDVIKTESLIFVSNDGSDLSGDGSLLRPYLTIKHALSRVTNQKNIIYIASGTYKEHDLTINKSVTIQGQRTEDVIIDGENQSMIFNILKSAQNVEIKALTLTNGEDDIAGAIYSESYNFTMYNAIISSVKSTDGGAVSLNGFSSLYNNKFIDIEGNASIYLWGGIANLTNNEMENVPSNAIYVADGIFNAKITYIGNKTIEIPKATETSLTATVTDDMDNPVGGGVLEFRYNGGLIGESPVENGSASVSFTAPNREALYTLSGSYSNGNDETIIKTGKMRIIKLGFYINGTGYETLKQALKAAGNGDTIIAVDGVYNVSLETIDKDLTIKANDSDNVVLRVSGRYFLDVYGEYTLNLEGLIMENAKEYQGFFIYNEFGTVNVNDCTFRNAQGETIFAVVTVEQGVLNVANSRFENITLYDASTSEWGGAIYGIHSEITVENTTFANCTAGSYGGAIAAYSTTHLTVINCTFEDNYANFRGGAIYNGGASTTIVKNSTFINNSALGFTSSYGGAICSESANLDVFHSIFIDNEARDKGGAIYLARNTTLNYNIFLSNRNSSTDNDIYFNWYEVNYPEEFVDANYNYWGTNEGPDGTNGASLGTRIASNQDNSTIYKDKWTILQADVNSSNVTIGPDYTITLDLSQYKYGDNVFDLLEEMPDLYVELTPTIGRVVPQNTVIESKANMTYHPLAVGQEIIYISSSDQVIRFNVEYGADYFLSANISSINIDLGQSVPVNVSVLNNFREPSNDLDGKEMTATAYEIVNGLRENPVSLSPKTINNAFVTFDLNEFSNLKPGSAYEIIFEVEDDLYDIESSAIALQMNKIGTHIDANDTDSFVGSANIIIGLIAHDAILDKDIPLANKEIIMAIHDENNDLLLFNGENMTAITDDEGIAVFDAKDLLSGIYTIDLIFAGESQYSSSNRTIVLNVSKVNTSIIAEDIDESVGKAVLDIRLSSLDNEIQYEYLTIEITALNGTAVFNERMQTDDSSSISIQLRNLTVGEYKANIIFNGTDKYEASSKLLNINIFDLNLVLKAEDITITEGSGSLDIEFTSNGAPIAGKLINIEIADDDLLAVTNAEGIVTVDLSDLIEGEYTIIFSFAGDSDYPFIYNSSNVLVLPNPNNDTNGSSNGTNGSGELQDTVTAISINPSAVKINETVIIIPSVISQGSLIEGKVDIIINGVKEATIDVGDTYGFAPNASGTYNISASFVGNEYYNPSISAIVTLSVAADGSNGTDGSNDTNGSNGTADNVRDGKLLQELINNATAGSIIDLGNFVYENVSNIQINKNITLIGDNTTIISANDGKALFVVDTVNNGVENVTIKGIDFVLSNGDTLIKASAINGSVPLSIDSPQIKITDNTIIAADGAVAESITVLELDSERGVLAPTREISIDSNNIESGINLFEFKATGLYNSTEANINKGGNIPDKIATVIVYKDMTTVSVDSTVDGRVGEYFKIILTDTDGNILADKPVQIGFNGKIYNRTTDENGSAKLQINLKKVDYYTFAVCFLGDDNYNSSFIVAKINVTAQKAKLTSPSKTYKTNAKTKTLTATLKSSLGNPIANKKISFTVNGKTYTAKTNSKGIASVNVSLSKKGTYKFTVKYAGDSGYAAISTSNKLVLK